MNWLGRSGRKRRAPFVAAFVSIATAGTLAVTTSALAAPPDQGEAAPAGPSSGDGWVRSTIGCAESGSTEHLHDFFTERQGPLMGWDNPHVVQLDPDRSLWLIQDSYFDYPGTADDLGDVGGQLQNVALLQTGGCFDAIHQGTESERLNFELGDERIPSGHFLWPLGAEVYDGRVMVFWSETVTAEPLPPPGHGITRNTLATWLATYDVETLERLSFDPAPNPGVDPQYGFAVASDEEYSYLFGNTNQLNFWPAGGLEIGPHSTTRMYLARVPRGRLGDVPQYWDGARWVDKSVRAKPFSERFHAENTMQPRYIDGQWVSIVNEDGFFGSEVWVETAPQPWGPWTVQEIISHDPRPADVWKNSYQPIILPGSSEARGLDVVISENALFWHKAVEDPSLYRPAFFSTVWPGGAPASNAEIEPSTVAGRAAGSFGGSVKKVR